MCNYGAIGRLVLRQAPGCCRAAHDLFIAKAAPAPAANELQSAAGRGREISLRGLRGVRAALGPAQVPAAGLEDALRKNAPVPRRARELGARSPVPPIYFF